MIGMDLMICSVCMRRFSEHTIADVQECSKKYDEIQIERLANEECHSCGCPSDMIDTKGYFWCHGCLQWNSQLNDERETE
jgi:hypothetical protein